MWPPGPVTRTWIRSQAAVIGAGAHAELAGVQAGVAVQGEDPADRGDAAGREHVQGAAGRLLGGLEDQPHPARQQAGGGRSARYRPVPSSTVVCTSWPQAWQASGTVER